MDGTKNAAEAKGKGINAMPCKRARVRLPRDGRNYDRDAMNKTESAYAQELALRQAAGEIVAFGYEQIKFKLADKTFYTPDFFVVRSDGSMELHEVKGFWEDDARVKIKVAAKEFPMFLFVAVRRVRKEWETEVF